MTRNREDRLQGGIRLDGAPGVQVVLLDVHPDLLRHLRTYVAMSSIRHLDELSSTFVNFRQLSATGHPLFDLNLSTVLSPLYRVATPILAINQL